MLKIACAIIFFTTVTNSVLAKTLEISEIFPNPKGKDKGNEWIELYNNSEETIDLFGWKLSNGGKKASTIKNSLILQPQSYFILEKENLKLALKNTDGQLKLTDTNGQTVDETTYGKAQEDKSFSKISIKSKNGIQTNWQWTTPSKNKSNQNFYIFEGKVQSIFLAEQTHSADHYTDSPDSTITILTKNKLLTISLPDKTNQLLIKTILKPDTEVSVLVDNKSNLLDYKILSPPVSADTPALETWVYPYIALLIILAIILLKIVLDRSEVTKQSPTTDPSPSSHYKSFGQFPHG